MACDDHGELRRQDCTGERVAKNAPESGSRLGHNPALVTMWLVNGAKYFPNVGDCPAVALRTPVHFPGTFPRDGGTGSQMPESRSPRRAAVVRPYWDSDRSLFERPGDLPGSSWSMAPRLLFDCCLPGLVADGHGRGPTVERSRIKTGDFMSGKPCDRSSLVARTARRRPWSDNEGCSCSPEPIRKAPLPGETYPRELDSGCVEDRSPRSQLRMRTVLHAMWAYIWMANPR